MFFYSQGVVDALWLLKLNVLMFMQLWCQEWLLAFRRFIYVYCIAHTFKHWNVSNFVTRMLFCELKSLYSYIHKIANVFKEYLQK